MEVGRRHWVVMTPDGEFLKVSRRRGDVQPGDEIRFSPEQNPVYRSRRTWMAGGLAAAVIAFFLMLPLLGPSQAQAETYVYLDLNPSLELGLNEKNEVIQVRPLNQSGKQLLTGMDWEGDQVDQFVVEVLSRAQSTGVVQPKERVLVSRVSSNNPPVKPTDDTLHHIKQTLEEDPELHRTDLDVSTLSLPGSVKTRAEEKGISPAKYAVWLLGKREGKTIQPEELSRLSINDLMARIDISPVLRNPPSDGEWEEWIAELEDEDQKEEKEEKESADEEQEPGDPSKEDPDNENKEENSKEEEQEESDSSSPPDQEEGSSGNGDDSDDSSSKPEEPEEEPQPPEEDPEKDPSDSDDSKDEQQDGTRDPDDGEDRDQQSDVENEQ
ncbi:hypothetical protein CHM34_10745 [Paludifilum halophilum]|uniref:RsgI N-terminal anti-sigma domain-containing protein n=2 Tax=Paludifilum halophilum TaxID=1642702 RepID=A0A235B4Z6_9BACL|nr:hypothetical protein CHM34_10745 [Paludifilum halophilum]